MMSFTALVRPLRSPQLLFNCDKQNPAVSHCQAKVQSNMGCSNFYINRLGRRRGQARCETSACKNADSTREA